MESKYLCIYGYFSKKDEALIALAEYNSNPYDITRETITFSDVYEKWSKNHFQKVSQSAIENYGNAYRNYCKSLYDMRFKDIRLTHLQAIIDNCGMAHPTRAVIKTLFNVLFKFAIKNDIVDKNYAQYVDVGKREGKLKRKIFTKEEIDKLFENVNKMEYIDTVLILIYSGLRIGELLDIKIENVHLEERYMIGGLKTEAGKNRIIPISKKTEAFIRKYYEQNKDKEYLITNSFGRQMQYSNYRREKFDNIIEKMQFINHRPHDTRHTFASLMDSAGANKLCIKRIMRTRKSRYNRWCIYT
jgi:integrase